FERDAIRLAEAVFEFGNPELAEESFFVADKVARSFVIIFERSVDGASLRREINKTQARNRKIVPRAESFIGSGRNEAQNVLRFFDLENRFRRLLPGVAQIVEIDAVFAQDPA